MGWESKEFVKFPPLKVNRGIQVNFVCSKSRQGLAGIL